MQNSPRPRWRYRNTSVHSRPRSPRYSYSVTCKLMSFPLEVCCFPESPQRTVTAGAKRINWTSRKRFLKNAIRSHVTHNGLAEHHRGKFLTEIFFCVCFNGTVDSACLRLWCGSIAQVTRGYSRCKHRWSSWWRCSSWLTKCQLLTWVWDSSAPAERGKIDYHLPIQSWWTDHLSPSCLDSHW